MIIDFISNILWVIAADEFFCMLLENKLYCVLQGPKGFKGGIGPEGPEGQDVSHALCVCLCLCLCVLNLMLFVNSCYRVKVDQTVHRAHQGRR